jgi:ribosomal protein S18 acetylase RimI-like enzyme
MDFTITHGFPEAQRAIAARLFWQAFGAKLGRVMGPEVKALEFLESALDPSHAISALSPQGTLLGLAGFKTERGAFIGGGFGDLARAYGWPGALWRAPLLALLERKLAPDSLLMDGIYVAGAARGHGIGTALLDAIKAEAGARGLTRVRLDVIESNPRARALYERQGFRATGTEQLGPLRHLFGFAASTTMVWTAHWM